MIRRVANEPGYNETYKILNELEKEVKRKKRPVIDVCDVLRKKYRLLDADGAVFMMENHSKEEVRSIGILICKNNKECIHLFIGNWIGILESKKGRIKTRIAHLQPGTGKL